MEILVSPSERRDCGAWPLDEVVVEDISIALTGTVAAGDVSTPTSPVIHNLSPVW